MTFFKTNSSLFILTIIAASLASGSRAEAAVTAQNVKLVSSVAGSRNGPMFALTSGKAWVQRDSRGRYSQWMETHRDQHSVYLQNRSGAKVQLDLHQRAVSLTDTSGRCTVLYRINGAFDYNAYTVRLIAYQGGCFAATGNGFQEQNRDGVHSFKVERKDEWSIYLVKANGDKAQLDLHRKKVRYTKADGTTFDLYSIARVR